MVNTTVIVHDELVREKLLASAPMILATNRAMATGLLEYIKPIVAADTPLGPGHFGVHGRDTLRIEVSSSGVKTTGKLVAAVQLYWREFGTGMRFRARNQEAKLRQMVKVMTGGSTGGEPATMIAHKIASEAQRIINFYYGSLSQWWQS